MKGSIGMLVMLTMIMACKNETKDKFKEAKDGIGNVANILSTTREAQEASAKLKEMEPIANDALKAWLPESVGDLDRTGYKIGKAGYLNVSSIEGTYKNGDDREFKVEILDGAGEMGSVLFTSMNMASKMEVEEEDEHKHLQTITRDGIRAKQTYFKKRNKTELQFTYRERLVVMVNAKEFVPEDTWGFVDELNLEDLVK